MTSNVCKRPKADIRLWYNYQCQIKFFQKIEIIVGFWLVVRHMSLLAVSNSCVILPGKGGIYADKSGQGDTFPFV